jgi:hypothetical protein
MKYLLDFDHTLLDTEKLKQQTAKDGRLDLVGTPEFWKHYAVRDFLFPDVIPWLQSKPKESLHIVTAFKPSQGPQAKAFQEAKCMSDGFSDHFESVTVMEGEKGTVVVEIAERFSVGESVVFVDDRLSQCLSVKEHLPHAYCFLMVREGEVPKVVPAGIIAVSTLAEVDGMMMQL